MNYYLSTLLRV